MGKYLILTFVFLMTIMPIYGQEDNSASGHAKSVTSKKEERISLDLKGIDIIELFRILSLKTGLTIVPSKGVTGRVNVFLNNLTLEDALDVILLSQELAVDKQNNVIYIMTENEYKNIYGRPYIEKRKFKSVKLKYAKPGNVFSALGQIKSDIGKIVVDEATGTIFLMDTPEKIAVMEKSIEELDKPMDMQIFDLNYAKAEDAKTQLSTVVTPGVGQVVVDGRSSKALVSDLPEKMKQIKQIIKALDEESRQVYIEGDVVQVILSNKFQRGIEWEKIYSSSLDGLDLVGKYPISPVLSSFQKVTVGTIAKNKYNVILNLLETYGDTKILSRPRIAAINNQEAKIMVGIRDAYVTQTQSQAESSYVTSENVEFIDVGVKLNVIPTINKEGYITMKIKVEVSSTGEPLVTALGSRVPIVETSEAETVVKVKDGTMVMLGGLIKDEKRDEIAGVPFLSKIPIIGGLFGSRSLLNKKSELVIFLTPHLMSGEAMLVGTEPEKILPPDIIPEDRIKSIISEKVDDIKVKSEEEQLPDEEELKTEKMPQAKETSRADFQVKMKGVKREQ